MGKLCQLFRQKLALVFTGIINGYTIIVSFCCFNLILILLIFGYCQSLIKTKVWNISFDFLLVLLLLIIRIDRPAFFLQLPAKAAANLIMY